MINLFTFCAGGLLALIAVLTLAWVTLKLAIAVLKLARAVALLAQVLLKGLRAEHPDIEGGTDA